MAGRGVVLRAVLLLSAAAFLALALLSSRGDLASGLRAAITQRVAGGREIPKHAAGGGSNRTQRAAGGGGAAPECGTAAAAAARPTPELFVAVLSAPGNVELRQAVRQHWRWSAAVAYRFFLCGKPAHKVDRQERGATDMMYVNCTEGYHHGLLTQKLIAAMRVFLACFGEADWFFKVDDDTFPDLHLLLAVLREYNTSDHVYAGRFYHNAGKPVRKKGNQFEEPYAVFAGGTYPKNAAGGPGYVLDTGLTRFIIGSGIAATNALWNEDKAVGVWVHRAISAGMLVTYAGLNGTDGYDDRHICFDDKRMRGTHVLIHNVTPRQMWCLHTKGSVHYPGCECSWAEAIRRR